MKKLLCLDMDNTIIYGNKAHIVAYNKAFKKNGLKPVKSKIIKKFFGVIHTKVVKNIYPKLTKKEVIKIAEDHDNFLIKETKKYAKPFKGVKLTLKKLKKRYKLALISNCTRKEILASLKATKIDKNLFDILIGSDQVKHPKPSSDEIMKAERLLHVNADYMVGDTVYDIRAGKRAKVKTIAVLTGNHSKKKLAKEKPFLILKSVNDLPKFI